MENIYEYRGGQYTMEQLLKLKTCVVSKSTVKIRLRNGWTVEEAIETPRHQKRPGDSDSPRYPYNGQMLTIDEIARLFRLSERAIKKLRRNLEDEHMSVEEAVAGKRAHLYPRYIYFTEKIDTVHGHMQPKLNQVYETIDGHWPVSESGPAHNQVNFVIIQLQSGDKLLVYENEFEVVRDQAAIETYQMLKNFGGRR